MGGHLPPSSPPTPSQLSSLSLMIALQLFFGRPLLCSQTMWLRWCQLPVTLFHLGMGDLTWLISIFYPSRHSPGWSNESQFWDFAGTIRKGQLSSCWGCWTVQCRMWAQSWQEPPHGKGLPASATNPEKSGTEREQKGEIERQSFRWYHLSM